MIKVYIVEFRGDDVYRHTITADSSFLKNLIPRDKAVKIYSSNEVRSNSDLHARILVNLGSKVLEEILNDRAVVIEVDETKHKNKEKPSKRFFKSLTIRRK